MFRFKTLDVITLFHKAGMPASTRVHTLLKTASATAAATATEDQASDHSHQSHPQREEFTLDVTEEPPTEDQLKSILQYIGQSQISKLVKGANTELEAIKKLKESGENFQRPVTVDWENGKAVVGDSESQILKMVRALPQK